MTWLALVSADGAAIPADAVVVGFVEAMESVAGTVEAVAVVVHARSAEMPAASIDASDLACRLVAVGRAEVVVEDMGIAHADQVDGPDVTHQAFLGLRWDCTLKGWAYTRIH